MATPSYVNVSSATRGIATAESGINVSSFEESWSNEKFYLLDEYGGREGFAYDFDESQSVTISGEITTGDILGAASADATWGTAMTIANDTDWNGSISSGGWYMDDLSISHNRSEWKSITASATRITAIT